MCPTETLKILINCLVNGFFKKGLFPLITALALVVFLWGVLKFIRDSGDEKARTEGKKMIIWGLFGLFMMLSVWSFVLILASIFPGGGFFVPQL